MGSVERGVTSIVSGMPVSISFEAVLAVLASHGPFADARRLSTLSSSWLRDITREAVASVQQELGDGSCARFRLKVDSELGKRLHAIWQERPLRIAILSRCLRQWQAWSDLLLAYAPEVRLSLNDRDLEQALEAGEADLILYEPLGTSQEIPDFLLRAKDVVLGRLSKSAAGQPVLVPEALANISCIHVDMEGQVPLLTPEARVQLERLVMLARGKSLHAELAARRSRWLLGSRHTQARGWEIVTTLTWRGEELIPSSVDLTAVVGWGQVPRTRFSDVLGHEAAKTAFRDRYIPWLRDPKGAPGMEGVLLWGPPGTGKSLLASAVAGEAGVSCIHVRGPELLGQYRNESEAFIRQTLGLLEKAPGGAGVLVWDEIDAVAPDRRRASHSEPGIYLAIVGEILVRLDALSQHPKGRALIIATTNHPDMVDQACIRSGRIGHHLQLGLPTAPERMELIHNLLPTGWTAGALEEAAEASEGLSQADHAALADEVMAMVQHHPELSISRLWDEGVQRKTHRLGSDCSQIQGRSRWQLSVHLAGHLLAASRVLGLEEIPPHVSLRDPLTDLKTGCLWHFEDEAASAVDPIALLAVVLAGQAAEAWALENGPPGPGCSGDMACATRLAHSAVSCGLSGRHDLPYMHLGSLPEAVRAQFQVPLAKAVQHALLLGAVRATEFAREDPGKLLMIALRLETEGRISRRTVKTILESPSILY